MRIQLLGIIYIFIVGCGPSVKINCPGTMGIKNNMTPVTFEISDEFSSSEYAGIKNAADTWNKAIGMDLIVFEDGGYKIRPVPSLSGTQQAITSLTWLNGYIQSIEIKVSKALTVSVDMESLMIHEFGHALGLEHTKGGVMDPYLSNNEIRRTVDASSLNSVNCLY